MLESLGTDPALPYIALNLPCSSQGLTSLPSGLWRLSPAQTQTLLLSQSVLWVGLFFFPHFTTPSLLFSSQAVYLFLPTIPVLIWSPLLAKRKQLHGKADSVAATSHTGVRPSLVLILC